MTPAPSPTPPATPPAESAALELAHRRYLLIEQGIGSAIFNLLLNGAIAWVMTRSLERVPLWGTNTSIAGDTIGTTFLLPFFTCLIVTRLARGQVTSGRLPPVSWRRDSHAALGRLPARTLPRALVLGLATLIAVAPVAVWALTALEVNDLAVWHFVTFKALFAALLAAVITPIVALGALGRLPARTLPRALVLGLATLIAVAPVAVWALTALEVNDLAVWHFVTFKALFAALLAAVITPIVALGALGDTASETSAAPARVGGG